MSAIDLLRADPNVSSEFRNALPDSIIDRAARVLPVATDELKRDNDAAPGPLAIWRERSRERLRMEPPHTECEALLMSLEALYEASIEHRPFSWACGSRQERAAKKWCVSRAFRRGA